MKEIKPPNTNWKALFFVDDCWTAVDLVSQPEFPALRQTRYLDPLQGLSSSEATSERLLLGFVIMFSFGWRNNPCSWVVWRTSVFGYIWLSMFINVYHVCPVPHFKVESRTREVASFIAATLAWQHLYETTFIFRRWKVELAGRKLCRNTQFIMFYLQNEIKKWWGDSKIKIVPHIIYIYIYVLFDRFMYTRKYTYYIIACQSSKTRSSRTKGCQTLRYMRLKRGKGFCVHLPTFLDVSPDAPPWNSTASAYAWDWGWLRWLNPSRKNSRGSVVRCLKVQP